MNQIKLFGHIQKANGELLDAMHEAMANDDLYNRITRIQDMTEALMDELRHAAQ